MFIHIYNKYEYHILCGSKEILFFAHSKLQSIHFDLLKWTFRLVSFAA